MHLLKTPYGKTLCLLFLCLFFTPLEVLAAPLEISDTAPELIFKDIDENQVDTQNYASQIRVYTFADKDSSERLMDWMNDAGLEVAKKYPQAEIIFLNFADVTAVPRLFRGIVEPILRRINRRSQEDLAKHYEEAGLSLDQRKSRFHLTPDWDGELLHRFGLESAEKYYGWIANNGKIISTIHEGKPNIIDHYIAAFDSIFANPVSMTAGPATKPGE